MESARSLASRASPITGRNSSLTWPVAYLMALEIIVGTDESSSVCFDPLRGRAEPWRGVLLQATVLSSSL